MPVSASGVPIIKDKAQNSTIYEGWVNKVDYDSYRLSFLALD